MQDGHELPDDICGGTELSVHDVRDEVGNLPVLRRHGLPHVGLRADCAARDAGHPPGVLNSSSFRLLLSRGSVT